MFSYNSLVPMECKCTPWHWHLSQFVIHLSSIYWDILLKFTTLSVDCIMHCKMVSSYHWWDTTLWRDVMKPKTKATHVYSVTFRSDRNVIPNVFITFSCVIEVFYDTRKCDKHIRNHVVDEVHLHPNGTRTLYGNIWIDVTLNFKVNGEGDAFDNAIFVFTELINMKIRHHIH